jgi:hypothetical protein
MHPTLLGAKEYRDQQRSEAITFRTCLATRESGPGERFRIFDGMHRAIQMVRNEETTIPLCVVGDP